MVDHLDGSQERRRHARRTKTMETARTVGIRTEYITRTAYDALLAAGATSDEVLYAIDEGA